MAQDLASVGTYSGEIATVQFEPQTGALKKVFSNTGSRPSPSWQGISASQKFLYTVEETNQKDPSKGGVASYSIQADGEIRNVSTALGWASPVSLAISPNQRYIFTANYGTASVSAYITNIATGELGLARQWQFSKLSKPGPVPDRQDASHPHQALFDFTGKYVVVPDLGADVLRMFSVDQDDMKELLPIKVKPGTGPRHGAFYPLTGKPKFYYLVGELSNTVTVFNVHYGNDALEFAEVQTISTLPPENTVSNTVPKAGEIAIHPNGKYLYVSNRLDNIYAHANSIASYTIDASTGSLRLLAIFSGGVENIRHFSIHPNGRWILIEGQDSNNIKSFRLDPNTGKVEKEESFVLNIEKPVCLQWLQVKKSGGCE